MLYVPPPPSALTLIARLTPTVAANLDALTIFTGYDNILIIGAGLKPSVADRAFLRLANAGVVDAAGNYATNTFEGSNLATAQTSMLLSTLNVSTAGKGMSFSVLISNTSAAADGKGGMGKSVIDGATPQAWGLNLMYLGGAVSGFRLGWDAGSNFQAAGSVRIYGYANT